MRVRTKAATSIPIKELGNGNGNGITKRASLAADTMAVLATGPLAHWLPMIGIGRRYDSMTWTMKYRRGRRKMLVLCIGVLIRCSTGRHGDFVSCRVPCFHFSISPSLHFSICPYHISLFNALSPTNLIVSMSMLIGRNRVWR